MAWPTFEVPTAKLTKRYRPASVEAVAESLGGDLKLPFAFLAQIDLARVVEHDIEHKLPESGLLSFFFRPDLKFEEDAPSRISF
jgi:hypothetical protein